MHPNEDLARRLIEAVEARDVAGVLSCYHEDVVVHMVSLGVLSGTYRGRDEMARIVGVMNEVTGGTMARVVHDVAATDDHFFMAIEASADRDGRTYRWNGIAVADVREGRIAEQWNISADPDASNAAFA